MASCYTVENVLQLKIAIADLEIVVLLHPPPDFWDLKKK